MSVIRTGQLLLGVLLVFCLWGGQNSLLAAEPTGDSHPPHPQRVLVQLSAPSLTELQAASVHPFSSAPGVDTRSVAAQSAIARVEAEQAIFAAAVTQLLPQARVGLFQDEFGDLRPLTTQVVLNAVAVEVDAPLTPVQLKMLLALPGVKGVYEDQRYLPQLYASAQTVGAPAAWDLLGGRQQAGRGVKVGSMDAGIHHLAPMFQGQGFSYPPDYPEQGLGLTANNNGKIVVSRAYFRPWDPPRQGDQNPWPGEQSISHGVHTASIAAGNLVSDATYLGAVLPPLSGVAPGAWVGSYRLFYASELDDGSFHTAEGLMALEDMARDGMDVVNNSWGGGPGSLGAPFDLLDQALVNLANAGVVVVMAAGNSGPHPATADHPSDAYISVAASTLPVTPGGPEQIAAFSSRGPSTRGTLKPDIAAPGVSITAQGYDPSASGEVRHLGYGRVSGTSMAAPHVAGAAALLKSLHPAWSNAEIKSVLMSTARYQEIYTTSGAPAQPLDMGAGRLDIAAALRPGVLVQPPQVDFGWVISSTAGSSGPFSRTIQITSVVTEGLDLYTVYSLDTSQGFASLPPVAALTLSPNQIVLLPGQSAQVTVRFDPQQGRFGVNQGYIVLAGNRHQAHLPFLAQVIPEAETADLLLINADTRETMGNPSYAAYYTQTLENLVIPYAYWDGPGYIGSSQPFVPELAQLMAYPTVLLFTGDNFYPGNSFGAPTPITPAEMARLNAYAQAGGKLLVMGQDASDVFDDSFFDDVTLGGVRLQDAIANQEAPPLPIRGWVAGAPAFRDLTVDLRAPQRGLGRQPMTLAGDSGLIEASGIFTVDNFSRLLGYEMTLHAGQAVTLTLARIQSEVDGVPGPVLHTLWPYTQAVVITDSLTWSGQVRLTAPEESLRRQGALTLTVDAAAPPTGSPTGVAWLQIPSTIVQGDGAGNQRYVDELSVYAYGNGKADPSADPWEIAQYAPLLYYPGPIVLEQGLVALAHRDQPTLERPGIAFQGRTVYTAFGLEGVNNGVGSSSREELLTRLLDYLHDQPQATLAVAASVPNSAMTVVQAGLESTIPNAELISLRLDWGDGSPISSSHTALVQHTYERCGRYTLRAEVTDSYGNKALTQVETIVTACRQALRPAVYLPVLVR